MLKTVKDTAMLANGKDTVGLHMIIVLIPAAIATVIAKNRYGDRRCRAWNSSSRRYCTR